MKIKCQPDDFHVQELTEVRPGSGPHALYRLTKRSLTTPEAIEAIARRWKIRRDAFSFGGMKDKHALTEQHVTIRGGPKRALKQTNLEVEHLGQTDEAFGPHHIAANRFTLVVRDLGEPGVAKAMAAIEEVRSHGLPNYFDEQRFGSVGESGEFVARAWCLGEFERALWLAIAEPNVHDSPADREHKRTLREGWGRWRELAAQLEGFEHRRIIQKLAERPEDFRGAMAALPSWQRDLYLSAFQSHLWNRLLARLIRLQCDEASRFDVTIGPDALPLYRTLGTPSRQGVADGVGDSDATCAPGSRAPTAPPFRDGAPLHGLELPLPSARERPESEPVKTLYHETLAELGLKVEQLKVKWPRDVFFKKGSRSAVVMAKGLSAEAGDDDMYAGRKRLTLRFALPRGAYATVLVKRVFG